MRISSIDIGSNAIRQIIVEIDESDRWTVLKKDREPIRLGTEVFESRLIQPESVLRLIEALKRFAKNQKKFRTQINVAVATSAMRDAKNSAAVLQKMKKLSLINVQLISGKTEALAIKNAVINTQILPLTPCVLFDIGGGSAELTFINNNKTLWSKSFPLGVVRLLKLKAETKKSVSQLAKKHLAQIPKVLFKQNPTHIIGTGGNFDALGRLKNNLLQLPNSTNLSRPELLMIQSRWKKLTNLEKLNLGLKKDRIDVLEPAIELILVSMDKLRIDKIKIPYTGLKEGVIHSLMGQGHLQLK